MSFTTKIHVEAPPDALLASLRESLREWRESTIPPDLAAKGVYRVVGSVNANSFSLALTRRSRAFIDPALTGRIIPLSTGQSEVAVRCAHNDSRALGAAALFGALGLWNLFTSSIGQAIVLFSAAGVAGGIYWVQNALINVKLSEAHLLMSRLRTAVDRAESSTYGSAHKPANER